MNATLWFYGIVLSIIFMAFIIMNMDRFAKKEYKVEYSLSNLQKGDVFHFKAESSLYELNSVDNDSLLCEELVKKEPAIFSKNDRRPVYILEARK